MENSLYFAADKKDLIKEKQVESESNLCKD